MSSYMALYRKFRPGNFDEVKGQDSVVTTLRNQVRTQRVGHAYLFCGTRGTGKTTIAKIMAKAVNCEHPVDGSPCNECSVCQKINRQISMNVIEIDAASNNGVDNIRDIVEQVQYSPTEGNYKVYIIDEVHMLSVGAFNALLKTLEEPPSYVIFILATTEAHKIPITILSRCQRYDFRRISIDTISDRLMDLMGREGVEVEEKAIRYVAKAADGSMRDALSLLDQCLAFFFGEKLTYDKVLEVLGAVDLEVYDRMFGMLHDSNVMGLLGLLEQVVLDGKELGQFTIDYIWFLRNLLVLKASNGSGDMVDVSSEMLPLLLKDANMVSDQELIRQIRIFSELSSGLRYSTQKRVLMEITLVKACVPQMEPSIENLNARMERLAAFVKQCSIQGSAASTQLITEDVNEAVVENVSMESEKLFDEIQNTTSVLATAGYGKGANPRSDRALPEEINQIAQEWNQIITRFSGWVRHYLREVTPSINERDELELVAMNEAIYKLLLEDANFKEIQTVISGYVQKEVPINIRLQTSGTNEEVFDIRTTKLNMEVTWED